MDVSFAGDADSEQGGSGDQQGAEQPSETDEFGDLHDRFLEPVNSTCIGSDASAG